MKTRSGRLVLVSEGPAEPTKAIEHYLSRHPPTEQDPVELLFGVRRTPVELPQSALRHTRISSFMPGRGLTGHEVAPRPLSYSAICDSFVSGALRPDVVIACAGPDLGDGLRSLGGINGYMQLALDVAPTVVLEEVADLPHIPGSAIATSELEVIVGDLLGSRPRVPLSGAPDAVDRAIARNLRRLVQDGQALALGVGKVADAFTEELRDARNLRLLSGAVTDNSRTLQQAGCLDATAPILAMSAIGDLEFLTWAARGPVLLLPSTRLHAPAWLAQTYGLVAILGALQVNLQGDVNAHVVGTRHISGVGGSRDYAAGAHRSRGGATVVALRSTGRGGLSNLVQQVDAVTFEGSCVDAVVTEHGVARLRGLTPKGRADELTKLFDAR